MGTIPSSFRRLSDSALLARVRHIVVSEREITVQLIEALMELDARRLYLGEGYSSLFTYCTQALGLTEHAAYGRIEAARASRRHPRILQGLRGGTMTLTAIGLVAPHLTAENADAVLDAIQHKSKREVEEIVARLAPRPDAKATLRRLPPSRVVLTAIAPLDAAPTSAHVVASETRDSASQTSGRGAHTEASPATTQTAAPSLHPAASTSPVPARAQAVATATAHTHTLTALAPERYRLQMTISRDTHDKLQRVRDLLRHSVPDGNLEQIFDRAITKLLEHAERSVAAKCARPRSTQTDATDTRHVPAAIKREVWARDGGRCAFRGSSGRCREVSFLEFHHVVPFAIGGETSVANLELRCRAHNRYEADRWFGPTGSPPAPLPHPP